MAKNSKGEDIPQPNSPEWNQKIAERQNMGPRAMRDLFQPGGELVPDGEVTREYPRREQEL